MRDNSDESFKNIFAKTKNIGLDPVKKNSIGQEVFSFMKKNPLPNPKSAKKWPEFFTFRKITVLKIPQIALASFLLFIGITGIITAQANTSLPGELLYPIKINVNENLEKILAFSDQAKTKVSINLASRRLQEIEQLIVKDHASDEKQITASEKFKQYANQASEQIKDLANKKMYEKEAAASSDFEALLKAHAQVIGELKKNNEKNDNSGLLKNIENTAEDITKTRLLSAKVDNHDFSENSRQQAILQQRVNSLENSIGGIRKLITKEKNTIGEQAVLQSEDNVKLLEQKVAEAKNNIQKNITDYQSSISSLQEADVLAKQSKELIKAKASLRINIPINILPEEQSPSSANIPSATKEEKTIKNISDIAK